ncbi:MAG TPA: 23S rRNA (guanosine(2251)-2'-O)-methyltransferase RlmB [Cytophagales bacterium]|jgi:23S rRNA (guanosine2251-2'-O)-methyltransferase|nr:23S rRNA (guanosine(2251)-2'-O)-methyltransferase RlmB [Cytophagales bacterium]
MINKKQSDIIYGARAIIESLRAGKEIEKILLQKGLQNDLLKALKLEAGQRKIPLQQVPVEKLKKFNSRNHQGALAFISPIEFSEIETVIDQCYASGKDPFIVICDRVTDIRNFGAIARTAECVGADAIVMASKGNASINYDAVKTSAGALHHIPVCRVPNLKTTIQYLKDSGLTIVAATEKTNDMLYEQSLTGPIALVLGSEEDGISEAYLKLCDQRVRIPLKGEIESLNVSVSAGIILYEILRQKEKAS